MFQWTYGVWILMIVFLMMGCGSEQQSLKTDTPGKKEASNRVEKTSIYPAWYEDNKRTPSDTANFYGYGMAVANDSSESLEQALKLARSDLRRAVDDSLEKLRARLVNERESSVEELESTSFIVTLRNSVALVEKKATVGQRNVKKQSNRWVSYVKTRIPFQTVKQELKPALSEHPAFYQALE